MCSSRSISASEAKLSIERTGCHLVKDADEEADDATETTGKGTRFALFFNAGYYTKTPQGLDFVFHNSFKDTFWLPGSRVVYYEGSHLRPFAAQNDPGNWGVLKTPLSNMTRPDIKIRAVDMPNGGYRLGWTCESGGFMNIGYGIDEEVLEWYPMELPDTEPLRAKVAELERQGLKTHFKFI
ncbi:hypothetical protein PWT90_03428 [Aphanocladium album]|nr:hypothetical protein PWT90_03428 [Aphanocladium album]